MALDFPNSPTSGQVFTTSGAAWTWDGVKWTAGTSVMPMNDNRIINGDMRIDQRNNGASGTAFAYTVDRWVYASSAAGRGTWQRIATTLAGFPYCLSFTSAAANVPAAGDIFQFYQAIEADMVSDFAWGTASAQPVTLSFWVRSTLTGTFSGAVQNYAQTRSYPFTYSIPTASTWTKIVITIPGDTAGTWVMSGNAGAVFLMFDLGSGTTVRAPASAWANGNFVGANGAVNVVATSGAVHVVTGVKLEIGSVATPFNRQSLAKSMADCQRYYQSGWLLLGNVSGYAGNNFQLSVPLSPSMRVAPTLVAVTSSNVNISTFSLNSDPRYVWNGGTATTTGGTILNTSFTASAEL